MIIIKNNIDNQKELIEVITYICNNLMHENKYSYYIKGIIKTINTDGTVNLTLENSFDSDGNYVIYENIKLRQGLKVEVNNIVDVLIRNGNFQDKIVVDNYSTLTTPTTTT